MKRVCSDCQRPMNTISSRCPDAGTHERTTLRYARNRAFEATSRRREAAEEV